MWKTVGENMGRYRSYPRLVGETGGKDFIVAHPSADPTALAVAIARGGFEYQGQKCSAASRVYVPQSLWNEVRDRAVAMMNEIKMGDVRDFRNFMGAVIDQQGVREDQRATSTTRRRTRRSLPAAWPRASRATSSSRRWSRPRIPATGCCARRSSGRWSPPTSIPTSKWEETLEHRRPDVAVRADRRGVRARSRAIRQAASALRNAAGNFYINDKPTGAVVGQQPFGGARASGTNDKAGSKLNLVRWVSARTVKETFAPPRDYRYPFMAEE